MEQSTPITNAIKKAEIGYASIMESLVWYKNQLEKDEENDVEIRNVIYQVTLNDSHIFFQASAPLLVCNRPLCAPVLVLVFSNLLVNETVHYDYIKLKSKVTVFLDKGKLYNFLLGDAIEADKQNYTDPASYPNPLPNYWHIDISNDKPRICCSSR